MPNAEIDNYGQTAPPQSYWTPPEGGFTREELLCLEFIQDIRKAPESIDSETLLDGGR